MSQSFDVDNPSTDNVMQILETMDMSEHQNSSVSGAKALKQKKRALFLTKRGEKFSNSGEHAKAAKLYFKAWQLDENNLETIKCLAHALNYIGARSKALELFEKVLDRRPNDPDVASMLGQIALDLQMWEQAAALNRIYISAAPGKILGYNNLATALRHLERFDEAISFLQGVLPLFPESSELWNILAICVTLRDGLDAALPFYDEALRLNPKNWQISNNLAKSYNEVSDFEKVIEYGKRAVQLRPNESECHLGLAFGLLGAGQLEQGWQEYEWRQHPSRNQSVKWAHGLKRWSGEPLQGKSIAICPEQGVGDELLFASAFNDVIKNAAQVYIGCDKRLISLFQHSFPQSKVGGYVDKTHNGYRYRLLPFLDKADGDIDYFIEAGSLFRFYRSSLDSFATGDGSFLEAEDQAVKDWRRKIDALGNGLKVGICWRSGFQSAERNVWYPQLDHWKEILGVENCHFINLQYGNTDEDIAYFEKKFGADIYVPEDLDLRDDFAGAAALTKACDLVVTIAAAPSMMSFAVGTPILWLFPATPWWCFGQAPHTPIFSNCRIITPENLRDWEDVGRQAAQWLEKAALHKGPFDASFFS